MNIGDGLSIQVREVNGKATSGIYIQPNQARTASKTPKVKTQNKFQRYSSRRNATRIAPSTTETNILPKSRAVNPKVSTAKQENNAIKEVQNNKSITSVEGTATPGSGSPGTNTPKPDTSLKEIKKGPSNVRENKLKSRMQQQAKAPFTNKTKQKRSEKESKATVNSDPAFVTLTQDQFNTILNLVKNQQDINISKTLKTANQNDTNGGAEKPSTEDNNESEKIAPPGTVTEPTSIPGLDLNDSEPTEKLEKNKINEANNKGSNKHSSNNEEDKEGSRSSENDKNLLKVDSKEDEVKKTEQSSASSFFFGDAAKVDDSKRREEQLRWREELDQQIKAKKEKDKEETRRSLEVVDDIPWASHFDTMQPSTKKISENAEKISTPPPEDATKQSQSVVHTKTTDPSVPEANTLPIVGIYNGETNNTLTARRDSNSHLRTMTSLLDPSQIDAMEVRRRKQQEQRRAIEAQMEEQKKMKKNAEELKRQEEEREEQRLEEERRQMITQFEQEKSKQHQIEEKRDRQTQELHKQMQRAQASAMKEKFERRQNALKSHGHDTSRLEKTHRFTLEKNNAEIHVEHPLSNKVPPLNIRNLHSESLSNVSYSNSPEPSARQNLKQNSLAPLSVVANRDDGGAIKLEISLNQTPQKNSLVATGVQTDNGNSSRFLDFLSDDDGTEYMPLPHPSGHPGKNVNKKKSRKSQIDRRDKQNQNQYDIYSRTNQPYQGQSSENIKKEKPKWGVGQRQKKFVPASERYLSTQEKERHDENVRRHAEYLLAQQALNDRGRLVATQKNKHDLKGTISSKSMTNISNSVATTQNNRRSVSPPVPAVKRQIRDAQAKNKMEHLKHRPDTALSVTTEQVKYDSSRHTRESPVPNSDEFVEYRRSETILNTANQRPLSEEGSFVQNAYREQNKHDNARNPPPVPAAKDPLFNADIVKQRDRQDKILKEISILRQGLLLKQREVASYPATMAESSKTSLNGNLPERTNELDKT
ncbi:coiled-coil domain-containing protein 66-like [Clavelina lepadiformis]|uniref:CCDC66 domain-containing protein n=1 Tax=Clavelina lepadiformis TaxID=159417 RepID=A0ABP0H2X8_CLALP